MDNIIPINIIPRNAGRLPADECGCCFRGDPELHDLLLSLEVMPALQALHVVGMMATCEFQTAIAPGDFRMFCSEHNWSDPMQMMSAAEIMDDLGLAYNKTHAA